MDEFGYLAVILSIILGLSVTQLLQGLSNVINARDRIRIYWPAIGWALLLLVIDIQAWWAMFGYRGRHTWTFLQFGILLLETILLYLLAALALPNAFSAEIVDLRVNYFRHVRWFFGSFLAVLLVSLVKTVVMEWFLAQTFRSDFSPILDRRSRHRSRDAEQPVSQSVRLRRWCFVHHLHRRTLRRAPLRNSWPLLRGQRSEGRDISLSIGLVSTAACARCTIVTAAISTIPAMT